MSVAIITGASSGIGRDFARELKRLGVEKFWFIARRADRMEALADELGIKATVIGADLATPEGIDTVRCELERCRPEVSFLVNAAGFGAFGGFGDIDARTVENMISLNVTATVLITEMCIPYMKRGGRIIELGSASAFTPLPYFNVYASTKAFVLHYTKALRYELRERGITATCLCPCWVKTEFIDKALPDGQGVRPRSFKPLLDSERVVRGCVKAAMRGRAVYATNWYTKLQRMLSKLLPDSILTRLWLRMLRRKNGT